ncbi:MAG TPA: hypothetical protein PLU72_12645 [Candidatus Ozemobacteraceae bacterium]|nr:hypothetical protein [Candidatus Ozemobacteraceae bacterium]HQG28278.1 hypothetical protein [Candidatus Ozemobacteraceae bacterium]
MFDPWTATADEAALEQTKIDGEPPELKSAARWLTWHSPYYQWEVAQRINKRREAIEGGDGLAILSCMRDCARSGMIAPGWLAEAFVTRCDSVFDFKARSWDEVFGKPFPKRRKIETAREEHEKMFLVYAVALGRHKDGERIDKALFESVGDLFGMCGTRAEELYYKARKLFEEPIEDKTPSRS